MSNYKMFLYSNSMLAFALGLFMPFWMVYLQDFGTGIEKFGFALGLMMLAQSSTSYFAGKFSDKLGRKVFLISSGLILSGVVYAYTLISTLFQLYILQIINGMTSSIQATMEPSFLGDVTEKTKRGTDIGRYRAIVGFMAAISMMGGGYLVGAFGFKIIFYSTAALIFISTLILFKIGEERIYPSSSG